MSSAAEIEPQYRSDERFGELMVTAGILCEETIQRALKIQDAAGGEGGKLGDVLVAMGECCQEEVDYIIEVQRSLRNGGYDVKKQIEKSSKDVAQHTEELGGIQKLAERLTDKVVNGD